MGIIAEERIRREEVKAIAKYLVEKRGRVELDAVEIRKRILIEFTRKLDAKIKNLQEGEGVIATFTVDIIGRNGKVRGGSGANRNMPEYIEWRSIIFERDEYTCQECNSTKEIQAHHIEAWSSHPNLRFEIDNGITLCHSCHKKRHPHIGWM